MRRLSVYWVLAMLLTAIPVATSAASRAAGEVAVSTVTGLTTSTTPIPYLNLSVSLANRIHTSLLNRTSGAYFYSISSDWTIVTSTQYSTLGNALIVAGLLQLYEATGNQTYLLWASTTSDQFWDHAWDQGTGGFYDTYDPNWARSTCDQITQDNAMFEIDFLDLYRLNGSSQWLQHADAEEQLLNDRFWNVTDGIVEVGYTPCTGLQSGDVDIETSIGSYLWATGEWTSVSGNASYLTRMNAAASFAHRYLWDDVSNTLQGGPDSTDCGGPSGSLGFMRSVYANLTGLEDCRKGANENIWGAMGLAELYALTGNSTLLSWTDQDLTWINNTLWDPVYGGYHNDVFRNDTLRSSCSSTNDPNDYPGWTQGEQPMFWWTIGGLTGNATMTNWSLVAEKWTAENQWNYTNGNGGDVTCLNGNALPDAGSPDLYDWIQGSALYSFSTIGAPEKTASSTTTSSSIASSSIASSSIASSSIASSSIASSSIASSSIIYSSTALASSSTTTVATRSSTQTGSNTTTIHAKGPAASAIYVALGALGLIVVTAAGLILYRRKAIRKVTR